MGARAGVALLLSLLLLTGCTDREPTKGGGVVPGGNLTVYSLLPLTGPRAAASREIVRGAKEALAARGGEVNGFNVSFVSLDETAAPADAARIAIHDLACIAVISDLTFETARLTVPIFNEAGFLQVSPAVEFPGFRDVESRWLPAGRQTFAPLLNDFNALAKVEGPVHLEAEGDADSEDLASGLANRLGTSERARTVIYAGQDPENAEGVVRGVLRERPRARVVLPPSLFLSDLPARLRGLKRVRFAETPDAKELGREAMRRILDAVDAAGRRGASRQAVIDAYFAANL